MGSDSMMGLGLPGRWFFSWRINSRT